MKKIESKYLNGIIAIIILIVVELLYFRGLLFSDALIGDIGDAQLNNLLVEHWYNVFRGKEAAANLRIFYPVENTIAYTDMLVGVALPYSVFRLIGINMYIANKLALILFHAIGTIGVICLLRKLIKLDWIETIFGVILFSLSNALYVKASHTQLFTVCLLPLFGYFLIQFFKNLDQCLIRKLRYGIGVIVIYELMMYTSFYIAFFTAFLIVIYGVVIFVITKDRVKLYKDILQFIRINIAKLIILVLLAVVITIPFIMIYIPALKEFGSRSWEEVCAFLPNLTDYFNFSHNSLAWGRYKNQLNLSYSVELSCGVPFFTMILFWISYFYIRKKNHKLQNRGQLFYARALGITIAVVWCLLLKVKDASLWWIIYKFVPGGSAIRAPFRINLLITFGIAVILPLAFSLWRKESRFKQFPLIVLGIILCVVIMVDNTTRNGVDSFWRESVISAQVDNVSEPPTDCEVFYITDSGGYQRAAYEYNLFAWEIANRFELQTINGYSGQFPKGWPATGGVYVYNEKEVFQLKNWGISKTDKIIYAYDVGSNVWSHDASLTYILDESTDELIVNEGQKTDEFVELWPQGYTWGPYISIEAGTYRIELKTEDAADIDFTCTADVGQTDLALSDSEILDDKVIYTLCLHERYDGVEFKVWNNTDHGIKFDNMTITLCEEGK